MLRNLCKNYEKSCKDRSLRYNYDWNDCCFAVAVGVMCTDMRSRHFLAGCNTPL